MREVTGNKDVDLLENQFHKLVHDRDLGLGLGQDGLFGGFSAEIAKISAETEINNNLNLPQFWDLKLLTKMTKLL